MPLSRLQASPTCRFRCAIRLVWPRARSKCSTDPTIGQRWAPRLATSALALSNCLLSSFESPNCFRTLLPRALAQSQALALGADVLLFVIDARSGVTPDDRHHARWVHGLKKPTILLANKSEGLRELDTDTWQLGFGAALPVSAEHGEGLGELYKALQARSGAIAVVIS
jgi:hypothetical protein